MNVDETMNAENVVTNDTTSVDGAMNADANMALNAADTANAAADTANTAADTANAAANNAM